MKSLLAGALAFSLSFASYAHAQAPPSRNLAAALAGVKADLAAGQAGDIVVLGDSLSFNPGTYLPYFRSNLQSVYGNAGAGYQGFSLWSGAGFNAGWENGLINTDTPPRRSLDGLWASSTAAPFPPTHTSGFLDALSPNVELQYVAEPGGGSFQILDSTGQLVTTIDTDAPQRELRTWQHTFAAGQNRLWYQPQGDGRITLLGQNNTIDGPGLRVHRAANGGWGVDHFLARDWTFDAQLAELDTDLVMVWIGQNDQGNTRAQYADKLNMLVTRLQAAAPQAEVVLVGTYDQGSSPLEGLVAAMDDVAASRGVGFINLYDTAGDRAFFDANRYLLDGVHFSDAGGQYLGRFLADAFLTDGASLVPEPSGVLLFAPALAWGLRRRRK